MYIVAEAEDYNRLKVILHQADGNQVTIWVKKLDLDTYQGDGNFNRIVYNPGMGTLADGVKCMGWTNNASYTVADTANSITFDGIRTFITNKLNEGVTDGTEINFYAMLFKSYTVTYLDNHDAVAGSDVHLFRADAATSSWDYTVNAAYTPEDNESNFEGWKVNSGGSHVDGYTGDEQNYPNATRITVHGNVTFSVNVSKGHWLIYDENGKGATYKAADFVRSGQRTVEPTLPMTRNGYTFVGWWTGAPGADGIPTGSRFEFGRTLNDNTQLYAKWRPNTTANYTVIIWKQNMFNKYHAEYKLHGRKVMALHRTICKIGNASFVTNLTTACGFATFIITSNSLLIEFGVVASLGIMSVFLLSLQIIPIFFSLSKPPSVKATKHIDNKVITGIVSKIEDIVTYKRPRVYTVFITLAVVMLVGLFLIDRAGYILDDIPDDSRLCVDTRFLEDNFGGVSPIEIVVISKDTLRNDLDYVDQIERLDSLQRKLAKYPEFSRSLSIADAVKFLYQSLRAGNSYELPPSPDTYSTIMKRMPDMKGMGLEKSFIDSTRTATRVSMNIKDVGCDRIEELLPLLKKDIEDVLTFLLLYLVILQQYSRFSSERRWPLQPAFRRYISL